METQTLAAAQEIDFSVLALFMKATLTNKLVLMSLLAMSFWSWSIIVQRILTFRRAREEAAVFDRAFWSGDPLEVNTVAEQVWFDGRAANMRSRQTELRDRYLAPKGSLPRAYSGR